MFLIPLKELFYHELTKENDRITIDCDLIKYLLRLLILECFDTCYAYIVNQNWYVIDILDPVVNRQVPIVAGVFTEVKRNDSGLSPVLSLHNFRFFIQFVNVSRNQHNVEPALRQLEHETLSDSVSTTSYYGPGIFPIAGGSHFCAEEETGKGGD